jgi:hypothetical protein
METKKHIFKSIRDYYQLIIDLYKSSESDKSFAEIYHFKSFDTENIGCIDNSKMSINSKEDLLLVLKAKYCIELTLDKNMYTAFSNAHYIAGDISKKILLGSFKNKTMTAKQKEMFKKSIYVDLSNIDLYDLRQLYMDNFIKNKDITFY